MNKLRVVMSSVILASTGCASERLYVKVIDDVGSPVSNATVEVAFSSGHIILTDGKSRRYEAITDENGKAVVKFNGDNSDVYWTVKADGYYPSDVRKEVFRIEVTPIPPIFYNVTMLGDRHCDSGNIYLLESVFSQKRKINVAGNSHHWN